MTNQNWIDKWRNTVDCEWLYRDMLPKSYFFARLFTYEDVKSLLKELPKIKTKDYLFLVSQEGYTSIYESLYKDFICPTDFDTDKIIFVTAAYNGQTLVNEFATKYNKKPYKTIFFDFWCYYWAVESRFLENINYYDNVNKQKSADDIIKPFMTLNRRYALHRVLWIALLHNAKLIDKGIVSFSSSHPIQGMFLNKTKFNKNFNKIFKPELFSKDLSDPNNTKIVWQGTIPYLIYKHRNNSEIVDILKKDLSIVDVPELTIEGDAVIYSKVYNPAYSSFNDIFDHLYRVSLVDIPTETMYYNAYQSPYTSHNFYDLTTETAISYTEKVYRPITYRQPFIALSVSGYLKGLRELGYKTFHPFIDESYDECQDDSTRILLVLKETEKLANLDRLGREKFIENTKEICEYNYNHFKTTASTFLSNLQNDQSLQ